MDVNNPLKMVLVGIDTHIWKLEKQFCSLTSWSSVFFSEHGSLEAE